MDPDMEYQKYKPLILCCYQKFSAEDLKNRLDKMENQRLYFSVQITSRWKNWHMFHHKWQKRQFPKMK